MKIESVSFMFVFEPSSVEPVSCSSCGAEEHRDSLSAACAGGRNTELTRGALELARDGGGEPHPRSSERMPDGDRAAVDVDARAVEPELALDGQVLGPERLVDFEAADLPLLEPGG